jgi:parvulin-like peptidyl-prolyl isomerase
MTKWGVIIVVVAFVLTIFGDWGAKVGGWTQSPWAMKVAGEEISFDMIDRVVGQREQNAGELTDTMRREIYRNAIDEIIGERLALKEAERLGLRATEQEIVTQTRDQLFRNEDGSVDMGRFIRARRDIPASQWTHYEKIIADNVSLWKVYHFVTSAVVVTPAELRDYFDLRYQRASIRHILIRPGDFIPEAAARAFYSARPDSFMIQERVKGRHILFALPRDPSPQDQANARGLAEAALIRLRGGENFNRLFASMKEDTSGRIIAQELDWFHRGQMVPEFDSIAFTWPVGRVTEIITTQFGYHVAIFDAHEMPRLRPFAEVADAIRAQLARESEVLAARELAESLAERIKSGEPMDDLARRHSSGRSRERGGFLGDVTPGEMTPELYPDTGALERIGREVATIADDGRTIILDPSITRAILDLEKGALSEVLRSIHGFHVVRIENRRPADETLWVDFRERVEGEYRNYLKNQLYTDWRKTLRDRYTIQYSDSVKSRMDG